MLFANPSSFGKNNMVQLMWRRLITGGLRNPTDTLWGLFPVDNQSVKNHGDKKI
jgi:hypothetical protein